MIKYSFEVPLHHLEDFEDLQDFHFTLSMLYNHPIYKEFIKKQIKKGLKTIWIDNSYNELKKPDTVQEMVELYQKYDCAKIVCPDDPTWDDEKLYSNYFHIMDHVPRDKVIVVVTNERTYEKGLEYNVTTFAYPFRDRALTPLIEMQWAKNCHFLGMVSIKELQVMQPPSCDTSMPIKLALIGKHIVDWEKEGHPHIYTDELPNFFNEKMSHSQISLARRNIEYLKLVTKK